MMQFEGVKQKAKTKVRSVDKVRRRGGSGTDGGSGMDGGSSTPDPGDSFAAAKGGLRRQKKHHDEMAKA